MSSGTPPHTLREVERTPASSRTLRVIGYVALGVLLVITLVLSVIGVITKFEQRNEAAARAVAFEQSEPQADALPASCLSPKARDARPSEAWVGESAAQNEAEFLLHPDTAEMRVVGQDGFNFWGDAQALNFTQALGRNPLSNDEIAAWIAYFDGLNSELAADGRDLVILVAPAKWEIYPEKLPEWSAGRLGQTRFDQFLDHSGAVPVVDVRDALINAKAETPVYSAVNSHWSPFGALSAWQQVVRCGADLYPESMWGTVEVPVAVDVDLVEAPNEFTPFGDTSSPADWAVADLGQSGGSIHTQVTDAEGNRVDGNSNGAIGLLELPATTEYSEASGRVLIVGDSMNEALTPVQARAFGATCQIRHNFDNPSKRPNVLEEARACEADVVFFQFTERYFSQPAPVLP